MITITLPWPPSTNTYWRSRVFRQYRTIKGRRTLVHIPIVYVTHEGKKYRKLVQQRCMQAGLNGKRLTGRLAVVLNLYPPTRRVCDVANYEKAAIDALEAAQVFVNDSQIDDNRQVRCPVLKGGALVVTIEEIPPMVEQPEQMEI